MFHHTTKHLTIITITLATLAFNLTASSVNPMVCAHMTPENNPVLNPQMYKDLTRVLDWDIGQREMIKELTTEHNYLMQCLFMNGFNYENLVACTGEKYIKVIQVYVAEFFKVKSKFQVAIANMVSSKGFASFEFLPKMNRLKKDLMDTLDENQDPDLSLARFEYMITHPDEDLDTRKSGHDHKESEESSSEHVDYSDDSHDMMSIEHERIEGRRERILAEVSHHSYSQRDEHLPHKAEHSHESHNDHYEGSEHSTHTGEGHEGEHSESSDTDEEESSDDFKHMYKQLHGNYLIYVSMKKIVKGFIFTTIRCIQEYAEKTEVILPDEESLRYYNRTQLESMFPQSEIERVFAEQKQLELELKEVKEKAGGKTFNSDLARQGKYNHLVALHIANGNLKEVDRSDTPEKIFKESLLPLMGPGPKHEVSLV
jgi:hypothetical protein